MSGMDSFTIFGGKALSGEIVISGAKNAALPILFATLLSADRSTIQNIPQLRDIDSTLAVLMSLGVCCRQRGQQIDILSTQINSFTAPYDLVRTMRASILALGPLLARYGQASISLPGGCAIGSRPVDEHIKGLRKMGATITIENGYINARCEKLKGAEIKLKTPSVTGTENLLMAATLAEGQTIIRNAAREPEVVDLVNCLKSMGAQITGAGTHSIQIFGMSTLKGANYRVMPDRIEVGTYLAALAACNGNIIIRHANTKDMEAVIRVFEKGGMNIDIKDNDIHAEMEGKFSAVDVKTEPYPGFPTDLQAQIMAANCVAKGRSTVTETIFENRFMHVQELLRMGANITFKNRIAKIEGVAILTGAPVIATDLRASASLVIAALAAQGQSIIRRIYHLDRGYERMEKKLRGLGANVRRYHNR